MLTHLLQPIHLVPRKAGSEAKLSLSAGEAEQEIPDEAEPDPVETEMTVPRQTWMLSDWCSGNGIKA